jgi:hypothetical protein
MGEKKLCLNEREEDVGPKDNIDFLLIYDPFE